jgi:hypothetical protein
MSELGMPQSCMRFCSAGRGALEALPRGELPALHVYMCCIGLKEHFLMSDRLGSCKVTCFVSVLVEVRWRLCRLVSCLPVLHVCMCCVTLGFWQQLWSFKLGFFVGLVEFEMLESVVRVVRRS